MTTKTAEQATEIRRAAEANGLRVTAELTRDYNPATGEWDGKVIDATVTVETAFAPGDVAAYTKAERDCNAILGRFPMTRPGSVWGTDSASVGGHAGLTDGYCRMNKSGAGIRLARQFT